MKLGIGNRRDKAMGIRIVMRLAEGTTFFVFFETRKGFVCHSEDLGAVWVIMTFISASLLFFGYPIIAGMMCLVIIVWLLAVGFRDPWKGEKLTLLQTEARNALL